MHSLPFVCFNCRKSFKVVWSGFSPARNSPRILGQCCPECAGQLRYVGRYFKAPPKNCLKQWRKVELLFQRGWRADDLCGGPKTLSGVFDFLQNAKTHTAKSYRAYKRSEAEKKWRRARRRRRDF